MDAGIDVCRVGRFYAEWDVASDRGSEEPAFLLC
jgi:hypothetical protein